MEIIRKFNPVGQGAFYTEMHITDNNVRHYFVYDCGSERKDDCIKQIDANFIKNEVIDILFISHFDADHVNCIKHLVNKVKEIKVVVIPLIYRISSILIDGTDGFDDIFTNNAGHKPHFIFIYPDTSSLNEKEMLLLRSFHEEEIPEEVELEALNITNDRYLDSKLRIKGPLPDWVFIVYNYATIDRIKMLRKELEKIGVDIIELLTSPLKFVDKYPEIKKCYAKLPKIAGAKDGNKVNEHSLLLYSGPQTMDYYIYRLGVGRKSPKDMIIKNLKAGCVYSGDSDWHCFDIAKIYEPVYRNVGTIQLPHHGSEKNFTRIEGQNMWCPCSYGTYNTYKHPSISVLNEVSISQNFPICVTEDKNTDFMEYIKQN